MRTIRLLALCAAVGAALGAGAATIAAVPPQPAYGQTVRIELGGTEWPTFLPATRYTRTGNTIVVDYEYARVEFGPSGPNFGYRLVAVGELVPGTYSLQARLHDRGDRAAPPSIVNASFSVAPPSTWGIYLVPSAPGAFQASSVLVHSAVYFDPATLRASRSGEVIRVDFDYAPDAPVGGARPPGYAGYAAVAIEALAPGAYRIEGYGRALPGGAPELFFERAFAVGPVMPVVEYYHAALVHYFLAGGPDEVALLDAGGHGGWQRTGLTINAWLRQQDAPADARPVCRFYARGPNSHFFTADTFECDGLKVIERDQRAKAAAEGTAFLGWGFEGIGSWGLTPAAGVCPANSDPVYRSYNNRAAANDSNHRFTRDRQLHTAMVATSVDEGVQLCSMR